MPVNVFGSGATLRTFDTVALNTGTPGTIQYVEAPRLAEVESIAADPVINVGDPIVITTPLGFEWTTVRLSDESGTGVIEPLRYYKPDTVMVSELPDVTHFPPGFIIDVTHPSTGNEDEGGTWRLNDGGTAWVQTDVSVNYAVGSASTKTTHANMLATSVVGDLWFVTDQDENEGDWYHSSGPEGLHKITPTPTERTIFELLDDITEHVDNAAAISGGLVAGDWYFNTTDNNIEKVL